MRFQHRQHSSKTSGKRIGKISPSSRRALIEALEQRQLLSAAILTSDAVFAAQLPAYAAHQAVAVASASSPDSQSIIKKLAPLGQPTVTAVAPATGSTNGGTGVTITGTNFTGATAVKFGAVNATNVVVVSATSITATSPAEAVGPVDVEVVTPAGTSAASAADTFTFVAAAAPTVTAVSPTMGSTTGGTAVTITGTNFTGATAVKFGAVNATNVVVVSATSITATSPAEAAGPVDVEVVTPAGTSAASAADRFTFIVPAALPTVTAVSPAVGSAFGGTAVTITGTNFTGATAVMFGAANATNVVVVSATSITATSPAHAPGAVDVTVVTPGGTSATGAADMFTFNLVAPSPTVTSVIPATGSPAGGTAVTITGTNFTGATAVMFGAVNATNFTVVSATSITATSPAEAVGVVNVTVVTPSGSSAISAADQFAFAVLPTVTAVSPTSGTAAGGTTVTITGTNFTGATAVMFGAVSGTNLVVVSATSITVTSPAAAVGVVDVTVVTPSGTSATGAADKFTFVSAVPVLTTISVSPVSPTVTALTVQLFSAVGLDQFGMALAVQPTFTWMVSGGGTISSAGLFSATTAGGPFIVTASSGAVGGTTSVTVSPAPLPTVTSVTPNVGSPAGGGIVSIAGTGFTNVSAVTFGNVEAAQFTVVSATLITATPPSEAIGSVDVTVSTAAGTSLATAADTYAFDVAPTIAVAASATPTPVTGTTTALAVLGASANGEATLTYTWSTVGITQAGVVFSANDSNAAKNTTATFAAAGTYTFMVTITDASGLSTTSTVTTMVVATLTTISVSPPTTTVATDTTKQFSATGLSQFGIALATQPAFTWLTSGGGTISASGLYAATTPGLFTVSANNGSVSASANVTVVMPLFLGQFTSKNNLQKFSVALPNGIEVGLKFKSGTLVISELNSQVYLKVTNTTVHSMLFVEGTISLANVSIAGPLNTFNGTDANLAGDMAVAGSVHKLTIGDIAGTLAITGSLDLATIGDITGTLAASGTIGRLTIGAVSGAFIFSGANLGANGILGGGDDSFGTGAISFLSIEAPVVNSQIDVGVAPGPDGIFGTSDDVLSGGGPIGRLTLFGTPDSASRFEAGQFGVVKIPPLNSDKPPKKLVKPLVDPTFVVPNP